MLFVMNCLLVEVYFDEHRQDVLVLTSQGYSTKVNIPQTF